MFIVVFPMNDPVTQPEKIQYRAGTKGAPCLKQNGFVWPLLPPIPIFLGLTSSSEFFFFQRLRAVIASADHDWLVS